MVDYGEQKVLKEFRLSKRDVGLNILFVFLQNDLKRGGYRNCDFTVPEKVLVNLKTLASESF